MTNLIELNDSFLIVIDVQDFFIEKLEEEIRAPLLSRMDWLIDVAKGLELPILCTAEDISNCGEVTAVLANRLPAETKVFNKMVFGLAGQENIMAAVKKIGRKTAVLVGLETDVCVAQSALGLLDAGYRVVVPVDAVGSPGTAHQFGLKRMEQAGVILSSVKGLYYEWVRTVPKDDAVKQEIISKLDAPMGVTL